jgi:hypothetical protein
MVKTPAKGKLRFAQIGECAPEKWGVGEIKSASTVFSSEVEEVLLLIGGGEVLQIEFFPRERDLFKDQLEGLMFVLDEAGP